MTVPVMDRPRPVSAERNYYLAVVAMILGRVGNMAANLASMALIARAVSPASFGQYVLIVGVIAICAQVADFGTTAVFAKQTPEHQTRYRVFWGNFLLVRLALLVPAFVAAAIAAFFLQEETGSVLLAACLAIPFVAARFFDPMYQVFGRPWYSAIALGITAAATVALNAAAALWWPSLGAFVLAYAVANILYVGMALWLSGRIVGVSLRPDATIIRQMLRLAVPIGVASLMTVVSGRANILFLTQFQGLDAVAVYGAAARFLEIGVNLVVVMLGPLIPLFSGMAHDRSALTMSYQRFLLVLLVLTLPVLVVVPYLSAPLVTVMYGAQYHDAAAVLQLLALVGGLATLGLFNGYALLALGITRPWMWITGAGVMLNLLLNALLVPSLSFIGAAWAQIGSEILMVGATVVMIYRHLPRAFPGWEILAIVLANLAVAGVMHLEAARFGLAVLPLATLPILLGAAWLLGPIRPRPVGSAAP